MNASVVSVHIGPVAPLGPGDVPSGFVKHATAGRVGVGPLGLDGDAQADLRVHGGPDKAVYGYGVGCYAEWRVEMPMHAALFGPGGTGENLALDGLAEADVCVGDLVAVGSAVLRVTQPRRPCFKFALRYADARMPRAMARNGRCGWYYRVVETGDVGAGDRLALLDRPHPDWSIARLFSGVTTRAMDSNERAALLTLTHLAPAWRRQVARTLL